ncbi:tyrosine-type recombinase/integrase [Streptomyces ramulosus]|uniref:Tyrosine-type recombinase/integrase n=1 Tax=Streptomyces ramulosus TaxID=47762 RepID=A0ABW1FQC4_9ACTN
MPWVSRRFPTCHTGGTGWDAGGVALAGGNPGLGGGARGGGARRSALTSSGRTTPVAYRVLILLLAYTGLRWGEASALKVGRVDLDVCRVHVVEAYVEDNGKLYLGSPKNHERRSVPIPRFLVEELRLHVDGRGESELLFTAPQGGPLRARNFRQRFFAPAVTKADLGHLKLTPYKLRHTAASLAIAGGADVNVVQTMLGHKSATLTLDTYGHLFPDRLDEVSKKMHKRRAKQLAKAKAKLEKAERKAREAAGAVAALEGVAV